MSQGIIEHATSNNEAVAGDGGPSARAHFALVRTSLRGSLLPRPGLFMVVFSRPEHTEERTHTTRF